MAGKRPDELSELAESGIASDDYLLVWDKTAGVLKRFAFSVLVKAGDLATQLASHITAGHPQYYTKTETDGRYLQGADISGLGTGDMLGVHNLSELTDVEAARTKLELGSAALEPVETFALASALLALAPLASPTFTGSPAAPTPDTGDNSAALATTAFVQAAIAALINSAPGALDTLNELAAALGDDPNFAATITNALALKAPLASPIFTGTPTAPTPAAGDNTAKLATTAFVVAALASYLPQTGGTLAAYTEAKGTYTLVTGVLTLNCAGANRFTITLNQSVTSVVLSGLPGTTNAVYPITLKFVQDATGGRTVSGWPAGSKGPGGIGTLPAVTSAANAVDYFVGEVDGGALNISRAWADVK